MILQLGDLRLRASITNSLIPTNKNGISGHEEHFDIGYLTCLFPGHILVFTFVFEKVNTLSLWKQNIKSVPTMQR